MSPLSFSLSLSLSIPLHHFILSLESFALLILTNFRFFVNKLLARKIYFSKWLIDIFDACC